MAYKLTLVFSVHHKTKLSCAGSDSKWINTEAVKGLVINTNTVARGLTMWDKLY
ncbi:MAG: hypothetical protein ABJA37_14345 [Ferruginibacter sp.]